MIAEIHGKISSSGSNLSDRLEDQLTGDVFGSLRYLDATAALLPFLEKSYFLNDIRQPSNSPSFKNGKVDKVQFWPWIDEAEPDILLKLELEDQKGCVIFVEVKYLSGLSSDDSTESHVTKGEDALLQVGLANDQKTEESRNQLVRQMRGMKKTFRGLRKVQIYLTADRIYPGDIISKARQLADSEGLSDTELYWLSWHDLPAVLYRSCEGRKQLSEREKLVVRDLLRLCEKKGFGRFSRMESGYVEAPNAFKLVLETLGNENSNGIPTRILNYPNWGPPLPSIVCKRIPVEIPAILRKGQDGQ